MQAHLYLGEALLRANSQARSLSEFEQAQNIADQLGTSEEKWKSLYGLGRVEEQSGNLAVAKSDYRQSIAIIEKSRSQLQLTALKTDQLHAAHPIVREMRSQSIFNNHVLSTRLSIQFTRAFSFRTIVDYNAVISNPSLVDLDPSKVIRTDSLLTYMLNPGTAIYAGYSNRYENLALRGPLAERISDPSPQTGSQVFVKISYSFRP
jgi:hypothetical protein